MALCELCLCHFYIATAGFKKWAVKMQCQLRIKRRIKILRSVVHLLLFSL
jgi:hypothetical protein